jgi:SAM-dependent methyltransferase
MRRSDQQRMGVNRRMWDESVPLHVASPSYDVPRFKKGWIPLHPLEVKEVGPVRGQSLLHLQCHFGMDTLSWARLGARVTGVDYSPVAVAAAVRLAREVGIDARFLESNVYQASRKLRGHFDVVYTGKGALCWLPDLAKWARTVTHFLKPGGRFFFLEDHPISEVFEARPNSSRLVVKNRYFEREPLRDESPGTYAAPDAKLRNALSYAWIHPISDVLSSLVSVGLRVDALAEYPYTYWHKFPRMHLGRDRFWHLDDTDVSLPLMYFLRASKPN